jgi:hypothetical protein
LVDTTFKFYGFVSVTSLIYKEFNMKKFLAVFFLLSAAASLWAQEKFTEFQGGVLVPTDAKTGFIGGLTFGRMVDESVGWGFEVDFYRKTYTKETTVDSTTTSMVEEHVVQTEIENATTMLPVYFKLILHTQVLPKLDLRLGAGIGYEFMWNSETNYTQQTDDTRFYSGFTWQVGGGLSMPVSRASDFFLDLSYHSGSPSRGETENQMGLPVRTEVDMSGFMIRAGLRLYTFGIF